MNKPIFSIIVLSLDDSKRFNETILSIHNQDFCDWECFLIVDKNIPDNIRLAKQWEEKDSRFNCYLDFEDNDKNGVLINYTIKKSTGEYFLFLNSGDILHDNTILSKVSSKAQPANTIICGDLYNNNLSLQVNTLNQFNVNYIIREDLNYQCVFIYYTVFEKYGLFDAEIAYVTMWSFFYKLICFGRITPIYIPTVVVDTYNDLKEGSRIRLEHEEKQHVLTETLSLELYNICLDFDTYKGFYHKNIFQVLRRLKRISNKVFSIKSWKEYIYKKRIMPVIRLINRTVREQEKDPTLIPIIIINYNRLHDLKKLVSFLIDRNHKNIIIIDNKSTYPPLLDYYEEIKDKVTVKLMDINYGHLVFWKNKEINSLYSNGYHVVTDFDILPYPELPMDYMKTLMEVLNRNKDITKVGLALKIDDIVCTNERKKGAVEWEKRFWEKPLGNDMYLADIDTTFALYPPRYKFMYSDFYRAIRIAGNFIARHGGFYIDDENPTDEDIYYYKSASWFSTWKRYAK